MAQTFASNKRGILASYLDISENFLTSTMNTGTDQGRIAIFSGSTIESSGRVEYVSFIGRNDNANGTYTYTNLERNLSTTAIPATPSTGLKWIAGTGVALVAMHDQLLDIQQPQQINNLAVTNANQAVSGIVQLATNAQITAGTNTGSTGASVVLVPSQVLALLTLVANKAVIVEADRIAIGDSAASNTMKYSTVSAIREAIPSSTTQKGTVELATDSEVDAATDTTRYVNCAQTKLKVYTTTFTRSTGAAAGTQTITHNLGFTPRLCQFEMIDQGYQSSTGTYDGTNNYALTKSDTGSATVRTDRCIGDEKNSVKASVTAMSTTTITLTWTGSAGADTMSVLVTILA